MFINLRTVLNITRKRPTINKPDQCLKSSLNNRRLISVLIISILGLTIGFSSILDSTYWQGSPNHKLVSNLGRNPLLLQYDSVINKLTGKTDQALKPRSLSKRKTIDGTLIKPPPSLKGNKKKKKKRDMAVIKPPSPSSKKNTGGTSLNPPSKIEGTLKPGWKLEESLKPESANEETLKPLIQDVVLLPDSELLIIIRLPQISSYNSSRYPRASSSWPDDDTKAPNDEPLIIPAKENLACFFHQVSNNNNITTRVFAVDYVQRGHSMMMMIRCRSPTVEYSSSGDSEDEESSAVSMMPPPVIVQQKIPSDSSIQQKIPPDSSAGFTEFASFPSSSPRPPGPMKLWSSLVFEIWRTEEDVVLFAKGVNSKQGKNVDPADLECVYGPEWQPAVSTRVTQSAQEVFRCEHPAEELREPLYGAPVTLRWAGKLMDSVVYYAPNYHPILAKKDHGPPPPSPPPPPRIADRINVADNTNVSSIRDDEEISADGDSGMVCACTMVYNVAKFVKEWGVYHAHLGVDKFVFYDNNSEDELDEALGWLSGRDIGTARYPWPWPKTQEAGLSHCVVATRSTCKWILFTDVDEFVYTPRFLPPTNGRESPLRQLISGSQAIDRNVGQISMNCRDFGPSGLVSHPADGVTQGYTCRVKLEQRHKSLVRLAAVGQDLHNVVHHFNLRPEFRTIRLSGSLAVVNHYKFQAWLEFRKKFHRRVSAYVVDWTEHKNMGSKDRTPGLGSKDVKPPNWETSFCEVVDTSLRNYTRQVFTTMSMSNGTPLLAWQL